MDARVDTRLLPAEFRGPLLIVDEKTGAEVLYDVMPENIAPMYPPTEAGGNEPRR